MWAEGLRCGACAARDQDGSAFEGEYWNDHRAKGVLKLANGDVYEGHFAANGRHGLGECTYADGSQFIGEWRDDKPDTDAGKWVGVSEIEDLAETYKGQATKKGYFSRSPGRKYQLGAARVVPDMYWRHFSMYPTNSRANPFIGGGARARFHNAARAASG